MCLLIIRECYALVDVATLHISTVVDYKQIQKLKISLGDLWGSFRDFDKFINLLSSVIDTDCHLSYLDSLKDGHISWYLP